MNESFRNGDGEDPKLHAPGHRILQTPVDVGIGHKDQLKPGAFVESLRRHARKIAGRIHGDREFTGLLALKRHKVRDGPDGHIGMGHQHLMTARDHGDGLEILHGIIGHPLHQEGVRRQSSGSRDEKGVAIGRGARCCCGADDIGAAGLVLDDDPLPKGTGQTIRQNARHHIGTGAASLRDDEGQGTRRPGLGLGLK